MALHEAKLSTELEKKSFQRHEKLVEKKRRGLSFEKGRDYMGLLLLLILLVLIFGGGFVLSLLKFSIEIIVIFVIIGIILSFFGYSKWRV